MESIKYYDRLLVSLLRLGYRNYLLTEPFNRLVGTRWCFGWMRFGDLTIFSYYWRPDTTLGEYEVFFGDLEQAIHARGTSARLSSEATSMPVISSGASA